MRYIFFIFILLITLLIIINKRRNYILYSIVIFLLFYGYNILIPFVFLDLRGLIIIILIVKLFINRSDWNYISENLFPNKYFLLILFFNLYYFMLSLLMRNVFPSIFWIRWILSIEAVTILGFIIFRDKKGRMIFYRTIIIASFISSLDIIFNRLIYQRQGLSIIRIIDYVIGNETSSNHNIIGFSCGIGFILLLVFLTEKKYHNNKEKYYYSFMMLIISIGIILSTSRSTILGIGVIFVINFKLKKIKFVQIIAIIITFISVFFIVKNYSHFDSYNIMQERVINEPLRFFNEYTGVANNYGNSGTMAWRIGYWLRSINRFINFRSVHQLLGIGPMGYEYTSYLGKSFNAHNGYILILVESGIIGFIIYTIFIFSLIKKALKIKRIIPEIRIPLYLVIYFLIYSFGQNAILTTPIINFLFGSIILFTVYRYSGRKIDENIISY